MSVERVVAPHTAAGLPKKVLAPLPNLEHQVRWHSRTGEETTSLQEGPDSRGNEANPTCCWPEVAQRGLALARQRLLPLI